MAKFSPDGIHISTRGREGLVIWDIPTLTKVVTYEIGLGRVYGWSFSNNVGLPARAIGVTSRTKGGFTGIRSSLLMYPHAGTRFQFLANECS